MKYVRKKLILPAVVLTAVLLQGCGGSDYTYVEDQELKPGPGLFSGKDGEFTLYEGSLPRQEKPDLEKQDQEKNR